MTAVLNTKLDVELERAITRNDLQMVDSALARGANPNSVGGIGYPMISWAVVSKASVTVVDRLVRSGADVNAATLNGAKPSVAELAMAFCRPDVAALLHDLGAFAPEQDTLGGTTIEHVFKHGDDEAKSKMDRLFQSLRTSRAVEDAIGPLEDAFSPAVGRMPRTGMSPL